MLHLNLSLIYNIPVKEKKKLFGNSINSQFTHQHQSTALRRRRFSQLNNMKEKSNVNLKLTSNLTQRTARQTHCNYMFSSDRMSITAWKWRNGFSRQISSYSGVSSPQYQPCSSGHRLGVPWSARPLWPRLCVPSSTLWTVLSLVPPGCEDVFLVCLRACSLWFPVSVHTEATFFPVAQRSLRSHS